MDHLSGKKILWGFCNLMVILAVGGCKSPTVMVDSLSSPQLVSNTVTARQLIIKFKPDTLACNAAEIAQLSSATRVPLEYVRSMSGNACVIKQLAVDTNEFLRGQELLRQHPAIEWLEQDTRKKAL